MYQTPLSNCAIIRKKFGLLTIFYLFFTSGAPHSPAGLLVNSQTKFLLSELNNSFPFCLWNSLNIWQIMSFHHVKNCNIWKINFVFVKTHFHSGSYIWRSTFTGRIVGEIPNETSSGEFEVDFALTTHGEMLEIPFQIIIF